MPLDSKGAILTTQWLLKGLFLGYGGTTKTPLLHPMASELCLLCLRNTAHMWLADGDSLICYIVIDVEADCLDIQIIFSMGIYTPNKGSGWSACKFVVGLRLSTKTSDA